MGLDNGIMMRRRDGKPMKWIQSLRLFSFYNQEVDLAYWRRCWGLRREIMAVAHCKDGDDTELSVKNLTDILRLIRIYHFDETAWCDACNDYWEYTKHVRRNGWRFCINLWLARFLIKFFPQVYQVYFYDSY